MTDDRGDRQRAEETGRKAETLVAWRYRFAGYRIVARRFKCRGGEIDLVAEGRWRGTPLLAFIEVKARAGRARAGRARAGTDADPFSAAILAVTPRARRRIESTGRQFIAVNPAYADAAIRYDIAAVSGWRVHLVKDAWRAGD